ncbi:hypothetical protein F5Y12DRAFT_793314 [Xylaria sp. FL1777]|nr:hypothetical protein F5Y12DRAFT_793314 [Xylaria sp. FL1777]
MLSIQDRGDGKGNNSPEARARSTIEEIRRDYAPEGHGALAELLDSALELVSSELYSTSTHFLFELLQNADDNIYDCPNPTIEFIYEHNRLDVYCNERGFEEKHVRAICAIRRSTKREAKNSNRFIGEKGIGFKSIFKVADIVYVSSREYHFMFDKRKPFGTIAPSWVDRHPQARPDGTFFSLHMSESYDADELIKALHQFDPTSLVFLHQIRDVILRVSHPNGSKELISIHRNDTVAGGESIRTIHIGSRELRYLIIQHSVQDLPTEVKRLGAAQSELVLAFPLSNSPDEPQSGVQNVYAFLPIGAYGFKFLLQGDFLLAANRLQIDESSEWNRALRDSLTSAFVHAVSQLNKGSMKYVWPFYVPAVEAGFFADSSKSILQSLTEDAVLESCSGQLVKPSSLTYVMPWAISKEDGRPFTYSGLKQHSYLSVNYPPWVLPAISKLGVRELSNEAFLEDLKTLICDDSNIFQARSQTWHNELAEALLRLISDKRHEKTVFELPIIPLLDGTWTSAASLPVLVPQDIFQPELLLVLEGAIVHPCVNASGHRLKLLERLRIIPTDAAQICRHICNLHKSSEFDPYKHSPAQLIAQTKFLCKSSWQLSPGTDLWFATQGNGRCQGSRLYMDKQEQEEACEDPILKKLRAKFPVIHEGYMEARNADPSLEESWMPVALITGCDVAFNFYNTTLVSKENGESSQAWTAYLIDSLGISPIPRLAYPIPNSSSKGQELSEEFRYLVAKCPIADILNFVNDNWHTYGKDIESFSSEVPKKLRELVVDTSIGPSRLENTFLPNLDTLIEDEVGIPILKLQKSKDRTLRRRLSCLGITVENDWKYYIECLKSLKARATKPDLDTVSHIYEQLQSRYDGNEEEIEEYFYCDRLVYVAPTASTIDKSNYWFDIDTCVQKKVDLVSEYPRSDLLFRSMQAVDGLQTGTLIAKLASVTSSTRLSEINEIFKELSRDLRVYSPKKAAKAVKPLLHAAAFPTTNTKDRGNFNRCRSIKDTAWLIADRSHLWDSFAGKVPLLAVSPEDLEAMEHLLRALALDSRRLSKLVESNRSPKGPLVQSRSATAFIHERKPFLKALIPRIEDESKKSHELDDLRVSMASEILHTHTLKYNDKEIRGAPGKAQVAVLWTGAPRIYIAQGAMRSHAAPTELIEAFAERFKIKSTTKLTLLFTALGHHDMRRIHNVFKMHGIHVALKFEEDESMRNSKRVNRGPSGDISHVYLDQVQWDRDDSSDDSSDERHVRLKLKSRQGDRDRALDRRAPIMRRVELNVGHIDDGYLEPRDSYFISAVSEDLDPHSYLEYYGQVLVDNMLEQKVARYESEVHWTSPLRTRAGLPYKTYSRHTSPFTIYNPLPSQAMTQFLIESGHTVARQWIGRVPVFHIEIAVSTGESASSFVWGTSQLRRICKYRLHEDKNGQPPKDISILIQVSNAHTRPRFHVYVDPWKLLTSGRFELKDDYYFISHIKDHQGEPHSANGVKFATTHRDYRMDKRILPDWLSSSMPQHLLIPDITASIPANSGTVLVPAFRWPQSNFCYHSLGDQEIRLLVLAPGRSYHPLKGVVFTLPFDDNMPPYRTLSYVWGDNVEPKCPLKTPHGVISLNLPLQKALIEIRHEKIPLVLWVDAICINQDNHKEKAQQIRLLPEIFQRATCTLGFLGTDAKAELGMKTLLQIRAVRLYGSQSKELPEAVRPIPSSWGEQKIPAAEDPVWEDVIEFLRNQWFRRVWIVQEAVLAPTLVLVCGKWMADWYDVVRAIQAVETEVAGLDATVLKPFMAIAKLRQLEANSHRYGRLYLFDLLESFRHAKSTMRRDRFFALLGLAQDGDDDHFNPDYDMAFEAIERMVGGRTLNCLAAKKNGLALLSRAGLSCRPDISKHRSISSWMPDWTVTQPQCLSEARDRGVTFRASGTLTEKILVYPGADEIAVQGCLVDDIVQVSKSTNTPEELKSYFTEVEKMVCSVSKGEKAFVQKWKVPIAGAKHPTCAYSPDMDLESSYKAFHKLLIKAGHGQKSSMNYLRNLTAETMSPVASTYDDGGCATLTEKSKNYTSLLDGTLSRWRFVITNRGYCGVAGNAVQLGDKVSILGGGAVPFILRESDERKGRYRLVGESYIEGIMDGQALKFRGVSEVKMLWLH